MLFIHASNVIGLGASQVVMSLIGALESLDSFSEVFYALPSTGVLSNISVKKTSKTLHLKRMLPNSLSRLLECIFPMIYYPKISKPIVLGDIPLRGCAGQVVLMHQPNLIFPCINQHSSKSFSFKVMRTLFSANLKFVSYLVVQTDVMKQQILASYPELVDKVKVIPNPPPNWLSQISIQPRESFSDGLKLFYPAAGYPHKNHRLILEVCQAPNSYEYIHEIIVTLQDNEIESLGKKSPLLNNLGRIFPSKCLEVYGQSDALFFPSLLESYGLPLVEAMTLGLPVICSDLPYARWMCEGEAVYFDPLNPNSALNAIKKMHNKLSSGWRPNWNKALSKFPESWSVVVEKLCYLHSVDSA